MLGPAVSAPTFTSTASPVPWCWWKVVQHRVAGLQEFEDGQYARGIYPEGGYVVGSRLDDKQIGTEVGDYHAVAKKLHELIDPTRGRQSFKSLSVTGRSRLQFFLADLIKQYEGHLDIELQVVDPTSPYVDVMSPHWGEKPRWLFRRLPDSAMLVHIHSLSKCGNTNTFPALLAT